jgi:hypothetical protein
MLDTQIFKYLYQMLHSVELQQAAAVADHKLLVATALLGTVVDSG